MLPANHPLRFELNDEVHARPPDALETPLRLTYIALLSPWSQRDTEWQHVVDIATRFGVPPPAEGVNHYENCKEPVQAYYNIISKKDHGQLHPNWENPEKFDGWR